jgi:hypothetical protein
MGIDFHSLRFIEFARKRRPLGRVLTIGRQGLDIPEEQLRGLLPLKPGYVHQRFVEEVLKDYFGALAVDAVDFSDFEGARYIHDMNKPVGAEIGGYDTIIDAGCLEHIYNVTQALANVSRMAAPGAAILHVLPAINCCGHGFWQFSPELFFSLYSEKNGYRETQVFLASLTDAKHWFEARMPGPGHRLEIHSPDPAYLLCRTRRGLAVSHDNVQQSDYLAKWGLEGARPEDKPQLLAHEIDAFLGLAVPQSG